MTLRMMLAFIVFLFLGTIFYFTTESQYKHYVIEFHETINGLSYGSTVSVQGVKVGEVESFSINENDPTIALVFIKVINTFIPQHAVAQLGFHGITGHKFIDIHYDKSVSINKRIQGIRCLPSKLSASGIGGMIFNSINIDNLRQYSTDQVVNIFNTTLKSVIELIQDLKEVTSGIKKAVNNMEPVINNINLFVEKILSYENMDTVQTFFDTGVPSITYSTLKMQNTIDKIQMILERFSKRPMHFITNGMNINANNQISKQDASTNTNLTQTINLDDITVPPMVEMSQEPKPSK
mgnify:FL=1